MRITERLDKHIRRTGRKCVECGEYEYTSKTIRHAGIEGDMLDGRTEAELVIASHKRDRVNKLEMIFDTGGVKKR
jgi:hypothetical protein